ncbi:alpha/beta hydrolase family protein [Allosphingosinicella sp.]|jgi:dienelactone hydrolase|uniref:alpha/beta hydrolase family protein n=1 Tax=Allosphingosinicella sp. TaxID=2823234 RepID=UPI002F1EE80F
MNGRARAALIALALVLSGCGREEPTETPLTGSIVEYGRTASGAPLRGALYRPAGPGPFPVLLYAHGSAPGSLSNEAFEAVAPALTSRGWALFAPYRRGQGLSGDAGSYVRDEVAAARSEGGADQAQARLARLLSEDHMADQAQAFAWLSSQGYVDRRRIAAMGNSFGGIVALLSAERLGICAAVDAAGAAEIWGEAPAIRALMTRSATRARAPVLFVQAENDFDLAPSRTLHAAMRQAGKPAEIRLYPPFGATARDGHAFAYRGVSVWARDVHAFLDRSCPSADRS